ncbi:recombinase family protein [Rhizobium ruizarguesonis]|uniref:recombinase family protein n=1 Tax=Rhizobium ruizarguesonis TaxID=2081791 RepID=UPI0029621B7E|nr:recombinase family protein [Rhizobium ruizarguesonis]
MLMLALAARVSKHGQAFRAALTGAREGAYDVLLCLTLDRPSRDLEHSAKVLKLLQFHDIELWTVHGGSQVSAMELGLRAVLNSEMLEQVRYRAREGMKTVAKTGRVLISTES